MGESAAQRTLDYVIIDHCHPRCWGNRAGGGAPRGADLSAFPLKDRDGFGAVIRVAGECDWGHRGRGKTGLWKITFPNHPRSVVSAARRRSTGCPTATRPVRVTAP